MDYHVNTAWAVTIVLLVVWDLVWRGMALWKSSRLGEKGWFVALLIVNSLGVLPIIYLLMRRSNTVQIIKEAK